MCIFCAAAFELIFYVEDCAAAPDNISMFFKERATGSERKCAAHIFCFQEDVWLLLEIFHVFFQERAAASERYQEEKNVRLLLKENVQLLLRIMST